MKYGPALVTLGTMAIVSFAFVSWASVPGDAQSPRPSSELFPTTVPAAHDGDILVPDVESPVSHDQYHVAITISGRVNFGDTILPIASDVWVLMDEEDIAVAILESDEQLTIFGARGDANVRLSGVSPEQVIQLLQQSSSGPGGNPLPTCSSGEHLCYCPVSAENACGPVAFSSHRCCKDHDVCWCQYFTPSGEGECINGVRATWHDPSPQP